MNKKELTEILKTRLPLEEIFRDYQWNSGLSALLHKEKDGFRKIAFQIHNTADLDRQISAVEVLVLYQRRFDLLHNWFDKFSFRKKNDLKYTSSIVFDGRDMELENSFFFAEDGSDFEERYQTLRNTLVAGSERFLKQFQSLEDVYRHEVAPMFEMDYRLPLTGSEWLFRALLMTHLFNPAAFPAFKNRLEAHAKLMNDQGEPNMIEYYPRFDEIMEELVQVKL